MPRLTDLAARSAKPRPIQYTLWDGTSGFGLRISPGGTKTWTLMYGPERRRVTVGRYPNLSLKQARLRAKDVMAEITLGLHKPGCTTTLQQLIDLLFKVRCTPQNNKPATIAEYARVFKRHLSHLMGDKLDTISHARINRVLDGLASKPAEANHAFVAFRMLFRFARERRLMQANPLDGMSLPYQPSSRDRVLTDAELRLVWQVAQDFPFPFGNIVALLIMTGQRLSEVSGLRWDWIDERDMTITLPAVITKNSTQHTFPISPITHDIIKTTPRMAPFLFPSLDYRAAYVGHNKAKGRFVDACNAEWKEDDSDEPMLHWTLHDLRRTFSTIHARIGTPPHVTDALLNHKTGTRSPIQRIYDRHTYLPEMRAAMSTYDRYLTDLFSMP